MDPRRLPRLLTASAAWGALAVLCTGMAPDDASASGARGRPGPPNVLVVLLDDWGVDMFDVFTPGTDARTPTLTAIAQYAKVYTHAYSQPVCSPTRAEIMLGRHSPETGVTNGFPWVDTTPETLLWPIRFPALPARLQSTHTTLAVGKWHMTSANWPDPYRHPVDIGFDAHVGTITNLVESLGWTYTNWERTVATPAGDVQTTETGYITTRQVDDALALANRSSGPWFMWLALTAPHAPWDVPPQELISVPASSVQSDHEKYVATLEAADTELGRFLADLRDLEDTVVFFAGDNGTPAGAFEGPVPGKKGTVFQGGIHVPLMVWYAGVEPGVVDDLVSLVDLHETILDVAGLPSDVTPASRSFRATFMPGGAPYAPRQTVYTARKDPLGFGPYTVERAAVLDLAYKLAVVNGTIKLYTLGPVNQETVVPIPYTPEQQEAYDALLLELQLIEN